MTDKPKMYRSRETFEAVQYGDIYITYRYGENGHSIPVEDFHRDYEPVEEADGDGWLPIDGDTPLDTRLLLWWTPKTPNKYAEVIIIGEISSHFEGTYFDGYRIKREGYEAGYADLKHITHWRYLPAAPQIKKTED